MSCYTITLRVTRPNGQREEHVSNHHANLVPLEAIGRAVRKHYGRGAYFRMGRQEPTASNVLQGSLARDLPFKRAIGWNGVGSIETVIEAHAVATVEHYRKVAR